MCIFMASEAMAALEVMVTTEVMVTPEVMSGIDKHVSFREWRFAAILQSTASYGNWFLLRPQSLVKKRPQTVSEDTGDQIWRQNSTQWPRFHMFLCLSCLYLPVFSQNVLPLPNKVKRHTPQGGAGSGGDRVNQERCMRLTTSPSVTRTTSCTVTRSIWIDSQFFKSWSFTRSLKKHVTRPHPA